MGALEGDDVTGAEVGDVVGDDVAGALEGDGVLGAVVGDGVIGALVGDGVIGALEGDGVTGALVGALVGAFYRVIEKTNCHILLDDSNLNEKQNLQCSENICDLAQGLKLRQGPYLDVWDH